MWFELIFNYFVGTYVGSYITTVLSRIRAGEKIRGGYSHCLVCGHRLGVRDVIPVFSYLYKGGRCSYCRTVIDKSSLLWEVSIGLLYAVLTYFLYRHLSYYVVLPAYFSAVIFHKVMRVDWKKEEK